MYITLQTLLVFVFILSGVGTQHQYDPERIEKRRPLIMVEDAIDPKLSKTGFRVSMLARGHVVEVYQVSPQKRLLSFEEGRIGSHMISGDGKRIRAFGPKKGDRPWGKSQQSEVEVETGKLLSQFYPTLLKNGIPITGLGIGKVGGQGRSTLTSDLKYGVGNVPETTSTTSDQASLVIGNFENLLEIIELRTDDGFQKGDRWGRHSITPDGRFVAGSRTSSENSDRQRTVVWEVRTKKIVLDIPYSAHWMTLSDNGKILITKKAGSDRAPDVWSVEKRTALTQLDIRTGEQMIPVKQGVVSPDGRFLATSGNKNLLFWDTQTGKIVKRLNQHKFTDGFVKTINFSEDGTRIAIGSDSQVVTVWSMKDIFSAKQSRNNVA